MRSSIGCFVGLVSFGAVIVAPAEPADAADFAEICPPGAAVRKLVGDCKFTEGPAWSPEGFLLFSDIPNNRIVRVAPDGSTSDFLNPSGRANGLMFDREGNLYACQGAGEGGQRRVVRIDVKTKVVAVVADSFEGKKLNSPNDLALDAQGGVYFTDPRYSPSEGVEQPVMGVYYTDASGKTARVIDDLERPNGILVSPDAKHLYVAEPNRRELHRYDITAPGKLSGKKLIFTGDRERDGGGPDGMAHDARGNIYATYKDVVVLDPDGRALGRIPVPEHPANCCFGGTDNKTLFITARTSVYAIDLLVPGMALQPRKAAAAAGDARDVKVGALAMKVPATWKASESPSRFRLAEFALPAAEGDSEGGELVVFYFGEGQGGGVAANVERWIGQFDAKDRKVRVVEGKAAATGVYTLVDAFGTYLKPIGPPVAGRTEPRPGWRMLAAIVPTRQGDYFLKLTGPEKTVSAQAEAFRTAFGADPASEKEVKR
jgi:gluconolactonase